MSGSSGVLSLLGLALRGGRLAAGEEPAALAAKAGQARLLLTASDAAGNTLRRAEHLAEEGHCLLLALPFTKAELGGALGRGGTALAALTDLGLAAAVAERLARMDPERYGQAAARMDLKRRRAAERKAAPRRSPQKKAANAPPPGARDRRPSPLRLKDGGRGPEGRRSGRDWDRPRDGRRPKSPGGRPESGRPRSERGKPAGPGRPYGGKPEKNRPRSGKPGHPGERSFEKNRPPRRGNGTGPKPPSGGGRDKGGGR